MNSGSITRTCPICQVKHNEEYQVELEEVNAELRASPGHGSGWPVKIPDAKKLEKRIKNLKPKSTPLILVRSTQGGCIKKHNMVWVCPVLKKVKIGDRDDPMEHYEEPHWRENHR